MITDVHTSHCCLKHGCKYGDELCTVTQRVAPQEHPCEFCSMEEEEMEERGEQYEYAVTWNDAVEPRDSLEDAQQFVQHSPQWTNWKIIRRRVSQWEEVQ